MLSRLTVVALLLAVSGAAQVPCSSSQPCVRITWIGQSCFFVQNSDGTNTVVTDPPVASVGYKLPATPADVVTISHDHTDHNNSAGVQGKFVLVDGRPVTARQEATAAGMPFVLIPGFHDNQNGAQRGPNTMVRWTQNGFTIAHLGDLGQNDLTAGQLADLRGLDIMFVPAGGYYTIDAARAAVLIAQLNPRVAVLMHFRTPFGGPTQLVTFPAVVNPFADIAYAPSSIVIGKAGLNAAAPPTVYMMEAAADAAAVNGASFTAGAPVAPGSLVSLFGNFAGSATAGASALPLPRKLGETEVLIGTAAVPLLYASPPQINFQVPRQLQTGQFLLDIRVGGKTVARASLTVIPWAPGIFAVLNQDGRPNSASEPARPGQVLQIYATGQGEVTPAVEDGAAAAADKLSLTAWVPYVEIGGKRASVQFSGLAPGLAGVWQINAVIPSDAPSGAAIPLVVSQALRSNPLPIAIQQ